MYYIVSYSLLFSCPLVSSLRLSLRRRLTCVVAAAAIHTLRIRHDSTVYIVLHHVVLNFLFSCPLVQSFRLAIETV